MTPVRFRFTDHWEHLDYFRFSKRWYDVVQFDDGICWFLDDRGNPDGVNFENFKNAGWAVFEGEEYIVDKILSKYEAPNPRR